TDGDAVQVVAGGDDEVGLDLDAVLGRDDEVAPLGEDVGLDDVVGGDNGVGTQAEGLANLRGVDPERPPDGDGIDAEQVLPAAVADLALDEVHGGPQDVPGFHADVELAVIPASSRQVEQVGGRRGVEGDAFFEGL